MDQNLGFTQSWCCRNQVDNTQFGYDLVFNSHEITGRTKEGSFVAEIGAGGGWFSIIAAKRVGENGKVFAVDINKESEDFINKRAEKEDLKKKRSSVKQMIRCSLKLA